MLQAEQSVSKQNSDTLLKVLYRDLHRSRIGKYHLKMEKWKTENLKVKVEICNIQWHQLEGNVVVEAADHQSAAMQCYPARPPDPANKFQ